MRGSLRHSLSRINSYRALCSPSLICLSSRDPFVTAFALTKELSKLSRIENEFKEEYLRLRSRVIHFAKELIENTRTSSELEIILNYDPDGPPFEKGQSMHLAKLREAVDSKQKEFVAHANIQQLLATVWYDGMPGFKRLAPFKQLIEIVKIGTMFPFSMKKPFIKFIVHSASYLFFLRNFMIISALLVIVSLHVETFLIKLFGTKEMLKKLSEEQKRERGALFSFVEFLIIIYIQGFIWAEIKALWKEGLTEYMQDLWNIIDFISNVLYVNWTLLRLTAWYQTLRESWAGLDPYQPRENWHPFDPMLIAEGMFGAAIFQHLETCSYLQCPPPFGTPSDRPWKDGINQLLWYYADMDKKKCYSLPNGERNPNEELSCDIWRRFANLFETSQSLFWASFGLVDLFNFELTGIKSFTRFWGLLMFGSYNVINVIVLLNLLIAMMSNSYSSIIEKCDMQWKFARSKLWMSYFEENDDVPPPFNLIPSPKKIFGKKKRERHSVRRKQTEMREIQYQKVICNLVKRFVTKEQLVMGKKHQARERRLKKGFNIGLVEGIDLRNIFNQKKKEMDFAEIVLKIQFYHRRGVFLGGEINLNILKESQSKMKREIRRPPVGWRKLQKLADRGLIKEIVANKDEEDISQAVSSFQPETTTIVHHTPSSASSSASPSRSPSLTPVPSPLPWKENISPNESLSSERQSEIAIENRESKTDLHEKEASLKFPENNFQTKGGGGENSGNSHDKIGV
ncbi:Transient receptor potential-gamma protein [Armadillidium vulgare]|nr:Transient receptor potential-gamma protein [Armadillidium vulgare]